MGILRSRKPNQSEPLANDEGTPGAQKADLEEAVDHSQGPVASAADSPEAPWVRLGSDALWAGVLPDDALGTLPGLEDSRTEVVEGKHRVPEGEQKAEPEISVRQPSTASTETNSGIDGLEVALSRAQNPDTAEFRILSGAKTPDDISRRFGWKTDKELAEAYEIASEERDKAGAQGQDAGMAYWKVLVDMSVREAANRPDFGALTEWEEADGRREKRESIRRLNTLARAREHMLRTNDSDGMGAG